MRSQQPSAAPPRWLRCEINADRRDPGNIFGTTLALYSGNNHAIFALSTFSMFSFVKQLSENQLLSRHRAFAFKLLGRIQRFPIFALI